MTRTASAVRTSLVLAVLALPVGAVVISTSPPSAAETGWQPFRDQDERARDRSQRTPRPSPSRDPLRDLATPSTEPQRRTPPAFAPPPAGTVERIDLAPIELPPPVPAPPPDATSPALPDAARDAPGIAPARTWSALGAAPPPPTRDPSPADFWRGVDLATLEQAIRSLEVPPRAPASHALWLKLLAPTSNPPPGGRNPEHFAALQLEALYRSGLIAVLRARLGAPATSDDPLTTAFRIRADLAAAETERACAGVRTLTARRDGLPKALLGEAHLLSGYCAAATGNRLAAGLAAELAREEGIDAPLALQALDTIAAPEGSPRPKFALPKRLMVLDYRLLELIGPMAPAAALANAEPALLHALAVTVGTESGLAVAAAEAAAAIEAIDASTLAAAYQRAASNTADARDAALSRAKRFQGLAATPDPRSRLTLARALMDEARKAGFSAVMARALDAALADIEPATRLGADAALAAEIAVTAGRFDRARQFAASDPAAGIWAPLAELADPALPGLTRPALDILDHVVSRGAFTPAALHRLAVVLDALDTNVPIPLWEAASRTPQPNTGYLPPTGTLPRLQTAAKEREHAHTLMLVLQSVGPAGAASSHLIALGDSLRALRRAGLDAEARALALDALLPIWPRSSR